MRFTTTAPEVDAFKLTKIGDQTANGLEVFCDDGQTRLATPRILVRALVPRPGDFWVIQSNGFEYVVPQETFARTHMMLPGQSTGTVGAGGGPGAA